MNLSDKMISFIETLKLVSGSYVRQPFILRDWQKDMIREVYPDNREVSTALFSVARKAGKSELIGAIALCHLWLPDLTQENQQILIAASDRDQASLCFNVIKNMILSDDELVQDFNIVESKKIIHHFNGGYVKAMSSSDASFHGTNPSLLLIDEIGNIPAPRARSTYDILTSGFGAQKHPMCWLISTRSPSPTHVFSELIRYGEKVNTGEIKDPSFKAFIYSAPDDCDLMDESAWLAANPALGDFLDKEYIRKLAEKACKIPSAENAFRALNLNQMVDAHTPFVSRTTWAKNGGEIDYEKLKGRECWGGLDLSSTTDLTAFHLVFPDEASGIFQTLSFFWKPEDLLKEHSLKDQVPYDLWAKQGKLLTTPGKTISFDFVAAEIAEISQDFKIQSIRYDRWKIDDFNRSLTRIGLDIEMAPLGMGFKDQAPCVNLLEEVLLSEKLNHGDHPVLTMCASNCVTESDPSGNRKWSKSKAIGRIDGIISLSAALRGWQITRDEVLGSIYADDDFYNDLD